MQASKATGRYRNSSWFGHQCDVSYDIAEFTPETNPVRKIVKRKTRVEGMRTFKAELTNNDFRLVLGDEDNGTASSAPTLLTKTQKVIVNALTGNMTWTDWCAASKVNANTFKTAVLGRSGKGGLVRCEPPVVVQHAEQGTWSPVQFAAEQLLHEPTAPELDLPAAA